MKLGLKGKSCDLAVRINGKSDFVDGAKIDDYGDAHSKHGFCNAVRIAKVQGEVVNDKFKATYFPLMPKGYKKAKHILAHLCSNNTIYNFFYLIRNLSAELYTHFPYLEQL